MVKGLLVQYQGGGYDGCIWERNFFLFDAKGKFHNLHTSGSMGIKTEEGAVKLISDKDADIYRYILPEDTQEIADNIHKGLVKGLIKTVNAIYGDDIVFLVCAECGDKLFDYDDIELVEDYDDVYCLECYSHKTCSWCGEYHDDVRDILGDDCIYCHERKKHAEDEKELKKKETAWNRVCAELATI